MRISGPSANRLGTVLLGLYALFIAAPAMVLLQFHLGRTEIIRTLCVERFKPVEENRCKGSCQLAKRLEAAGADSEEQGSAPQLRIVELLALPTNGPILAGPGSSPRRFPGTESWLEAGVRAMPEPVPWSA